MEIIIEYMKRKIENTLLKEIPHDSRDSYYRWQYDIFFTLL